jgi:hypothetical protein
MVKAGQQFWAGSGYATALPTLDFETYSEAGYRWDAALNKWQSLPGFATTKRGLEVVGTRNYVTHPSFDVLSLSYDLLTDTGERLWLPEHFDWPTDLFDHIRRGGLLEGWNVGFEWTVWNYFCVPRWGWPPLPFTQLRCAMAKARHHALPGKLEKAGEVVASRRDALTAEQIMAMCTPRPPVEDDDIPF